MRLQPRIGRQQACERDTRRDGLAGVGQHGGDDSVLRRPHDETLPRFVLGRELRDRREVTVDLAARRLRLQRQLAALRFERGDLAQLRSPLPLERLQLRLQAEDLLRLGLHLRRRHEVVVAQRFESRQRLLREREPLVLQIGLGTDRAELAAHVADLQLERRELVLLEQAALAHRILQAAFARARLLWIAVWASPLEVLWPIASTNSTSPWRTARPFGDVVLDHVAACGAISRIRPGRVPDSR
jgi:hypothetical protein